MQDRLSEFVGISVVSKEIRKLMSRWRLRRCVAPAGESFDIGGGRLKNGRWLALDLRSWRWRGRRRCGRFGCPVRCASLEGLLSLGSEFAGGCSQIGQRCAFGWSAGGLGRMLWRSGGATGLAGNLLNRPIA